MDHLKWSVLTVLAGALSLAAPAPADQPGEKLQRLIDEAWDFDMRENPLYATQVGDHRFNDRLGGVSLDDAKRRLEAKQEFLKRLGSIDREKLSRQRQIDYDIFRRLTEDEVAEYEFNSHLAPITNRDGFHIQYPELGKRSPLATVKDYENYIARLNKFDDYVAEHIDVMRAGMKRDVTLPGVVLKGYRDSLTPHIVDDPTKSLLYEPFTKFPASLDDATGKRLERAGREAIAAGVVAGYRRFLEFMTDEYVPAARGTIGASALPNGRAFYRYRVRKFTTLDITPEQVHETGLQEVKRIRAEMLKVARKAGYEGIDKFVEHLRTDPKFYAKTPQELMEKTAEACKRADGRLPKLFKTLPRMPYGLRKVPDYIAPSTTSAYYSRPAGDGSDAGYYYVNTYNLKARPLYGVEALSLHEAVPGHHLQIALQQELEGLPKFRRFAGFTVFVEGWALYAERLGLEMGFYQDPYSDYGRLTYEMWRACRLVVDTGIHYLGWSRQRAIDFMAENTALSMHNITAEVDRYISWPGQALAYKTGELRIRQLRQRAEKQLGDRFDVREFHEVVLGDGAVPLSVLEENVDNYIKTTGAGQSTDAKTSVVYPPSRRGDHVDILHGERIADPYRWLEDSDSPETGRWIKAQNKRTFGYLGAIAGREKIRRRVTELWNYERYGLPRRRGERMFFTKNDGLQNQAVLYVTDSPDGEPRVLLDPNKLSDDGTVSLARWRVSDDGATLAYGLSSSGSDWREWRFRDVASGRDLEDRLKWVKFSDVSWLPDSSGVYYSRYDEPADNKLTAVNFYQKLYFHRIGAPQAKDRLVHHRPDKKKWGFAADVSEDGRYLVISVRRSTAPENRVLYQDLTKPDGKIIELIGDFDAQYVFLGAQRERFYFRTTRNAERGRVIAIDLPRPRRQAWTEIVAEQAETLRGASLVGGQLFLAYLKDAHSVVRRFDPDGKPRGEVKLPGVGSVGGFGGKQNARVTYYSFASFTRPATIYRYDIATGESSVFRAPKVAFDPDAYQTRQVFYKSKDGTRIPMFITHKKGLKPDGDTPTMLYGYGGFNVPITPGFSATNLVWMEQGGVYAVANLRGGGEYGRAWHDAGRKANKQNVFDDFIAAAGWLIENRYTRPDRLAIHGRSNGGLLVGACATQRPELFGVALPGVGVLDMLRFHKFTIGWAWTADYGSPDDPQEFKHLRAYSPLHNVRPGTAYPATLIMTADHDDRVAPAHSFKFAAALQSAQTSAAPVLIRIETRAGHGAGVPVSKRIAAATDLLSFTLHELGVEIR